MAGLLVVCRWKESILANKAPAWGAQRQNRVSAYKPLGQRATKSVV
jgi:hypothetical protein